MPDGSTAPASFRVTARAAAQVADIAAREGRPDAGLRLAVEAGGCSGFQYKFGLEDAPAHDDMVIGEGQGRVDGRLRRSEHDVRGMEIRASRCAERRQRDEDLHRRRVAY